MPQNTHLELIGAEAERLAEFAHEDCDIELLRQKAADLACSLTPVPGVTSSPVLRGRCHSLKSNFKPLFAALESVPATSSVSDDFRWLYDNSRMLYAELQSAVTALRAEKELAHVRTQEGRPVPSWPSRKAFLRVFPMNSARLSSQLLSKRFNKPPF